MKLVDCIYIFLLSRLCQALQNFTETDPNGPVRTEEIVNDPYLQKFTTCSFTLKMPKNSSHEVVALTEDSAVVLLEEICSKLDCGSLFHLNKSRPSDNTTCFHRCLYQDGLLRNCSLSHNNCTLISGVVCGQQAMRLAGGSDRCAGRVELWRNGRWGTVCDDHWDLRDADVACGQLGCGYALGVMGQGGLFPPGRGPVYLDDLNCTGKEDNLWSCPAAVDKPNCGHKEDAGVTCSEMRAVRLTGGLDRCSGRVEIHRNGSWGTVCDNCWNQKLASMVCAMLQCGTEAIKFSQFVPPLLHNVGTQWFYSCSPNARNLWECREISNKPRLCKDSKASGVICKGSFGFRRANIRKSTVTTTLMTDDPYLQKFTTCSFTLKMPKNSSHEVVALTEDSAVVLLEEICSKLECGSLFHLNKSRLSDNTTCFHRCLYQDGLLRNCSLSHNNCTLISGVVCGQQAMRLAGGSDRCAGRVELWRNGGWGTVCDDHWDLRDADVACGQLGCGYALGVMGQGGPFPPGRGPVYLDDLNCTGKEDNLWSCPAAVDKPNCGHKEDAGVTCSEMRAVRLTGGLDRCSGRVEIHRNGSWGTVCDNCWNQKLASMVCAMLQCGTEAVKFSQFVPPLVHNVGTQWFYSCSPNVQNLWECREISNKPRLCKDSKASGVICNGSLGFPTANIGKSTVTTSLMTDDPYLQKFTTCSFTLKMPKNSSHEVVALTEDSAAVLLEEICSKLECGSLFHLNKSRLSDNTTCFHRCLYQDGLLRNCSSSHNNCMLISGVVCGQQAMRLAGGSDRCAGRVELWRNGGWGTVCDDHWDLRDADVACGQLGCGYALGVTGQGGPFPPGQGPVYLDDLNCTGKEDNLWSCPAAEDEPDCGHKEDAGVTCSEMRAVRLTGGLDHCSGRVEIHRNGSWGTVCDNCWNQKLASMVCTMLQCGTEAVKFSQFVPPLVHNVGTQWFYSCSPKARNLWECREISNKPRLCKDSKASGVICNGSLGFPTANIINSTVMTILMTEATTTTIPAENISMLSSLSSPGLLSTLALSLLLLTVFLITNTVLCCHYRRRCVILLQQSSSNRQGPSDCFTSYKDTVSLTNITYNSLQRDVSNQPSLWTQLNDDDKASVDSDYEPSKEPSALLSTFRNSQNCVTVENSAMRHSGAKRDSGDDLSDMTEVMGITPYSNEEVLHYARVSEVSFDSSHTSRGEFYKNATSHDLVATGIIIPGPSQSSVISDHLRPDSSDQPQSSASQNNLHPM